MIVYAVEWPLPMGHRYISEDAKVWHAREHLLLVKRYLRMGPSSPLLLITIEYTACPRCSLIALRVACTQLASMHA